MIVFDEGVEKESVVSSQAGLTMLSHLPIVKGCGMRHA
jgi:hypothetical protein